MIRNGFVSNVSSFDGYGSRSDCTFTVLVACVSPYCIADSGNCVRLVRKHGKDIRKVFIYKVWPIRHGYVMMREYFRKVRQRFGC